MDRDVLVSCLACLTSPRAILAEESRLASLRSQVCIPIIHQIAQFLEPSEFERLRVTNRKNGKLHLTAYVPRVNKYFPMERILNLRGGLPISHLEIEATHVDIPPSVTSVVAYRCNLEYGQWREIPPNVETLSLQGCYNLHVVDYCNVQRLVVRPGRDHYGADPSEPTSYRVFPNVRVLEIVATCHWQRTDTIRKLKFPKLEHLVWRVYSYSENNLLFSLLYALKVPRLTWVIEKSHGKPPSLKWVHLPHLKYVCIYSEGAEPRNHCALNGIDFHYPDSGNILEEIIFSFFPQ